MELVNEMQAQEPLDEGVHPEVAKKCARTADADAGADGAALAEELWEMLGHSGGLDASRMAGVHPEDLAEEEQVEVVIQINGRVRGKICVDDGIGEEELVERAFDDPRIAQLLVGKKIVKSIVVPKKLVNIVVSSRFAREIPRTRERSNGKFRGSSGAEPLSAKSESTGLSTRGGIVVLDFGGQYTQLIARRIREQQVFSAILPCTHPLDEIRAYEPVGIVLSGGPSSVYDADAPPCDAGSAGARRSGPRHLLRHAVDCAHAGRERRESGRAANTGARSSIREDGSRAIRGLPASFERSGKPWRSRGWLCRTDFDTTGRTDNAVAAVEDPRAASLRRAISSRSAAHRTRHRNSAQFRFRRLRREARSGAAPPSSPKPSKPFANRSAAGARSARSAVAWIPRWPPPWCTAPSATG